MALQLEQQCDASQERCMVCNTPLVDAEEYVHVNYVGYFCLGCRPADPVLCQVAMANGPMPSHC